jgi:hypothetical protein
VEWLSQVESELAVGAIPHDARVAIQFVEDAQLLAEAYYYFSFVVATCCGCYPASLRSSAWGFAPSGTI